MTDDLRTQIRRALAEADGHDFDSLEPYDYQQHADKVLALVQPIADQLAFTSTDRLKLTTMDRDSWQELADLTRQRAERAEADLAALRSQLRDAEAQRDPLVVNEMTDSYLIGRKVASAGLYNTVLRRAMKAEAERDGRREVERSQAEAAVQRVRGWLGEWGPRLPDGACHTLDRALDGTPQLTEPRHVDYPIGNPRPAIVDHTYAGPPTFGQRCQDDLAGATCGGLFEDHVMHEPCCHLDSKQLGARPGDLSVWCACGTQISPGLPNPSQEPQ